MPSLRSDDDVPLSCLAPLLSLFKTGSDRTKKGAASTSLALPSNQRSSGQSSSSAASLTSPSSSSEKASKPWFGQHQIEGLDEVDPPSYGLSEETDVGRPFAGQNVLAAIKSDMTALSPDLRKISCKIHAHPELMYKEVYAHDTLTKYLSGIKGVKVEKSYLLPTAFRATFSYGKGGKVVGVNSEYDALPGIGHACGHNLIAIVGLGTFLTLRKLLIKEKINGTVILLGTPAEEGGGGKIKLLEQGAYDGMDACLMSHPSTASAGGKYGHVGPSLASAFLDVEYTGRTAHAAGSPWEGINGLDAATLAYASLSALRQQILPSQRMHGIILPPASGWARNIIPDKAIVEYQVRSPTMESLEVLLKRVVACFEAAALATGCTIKIDRPSPYADLKNNFSLGDEYVRVMNDTYAHTITFDKGPATEGGSTDAGNCSHALPFLHPHFTIAEGPGGGNHTALFTDSAITPEAHEEALKSAVGLAGVGARVFMDKDFQL